MALPFTDWYELPFFILSSTPILGLPGGLLPSTLPSITREGRSPLRNVCPSQALCLVLMVDIIPSLCQHAGVPHCFSLCLTSRCPGFFSKATFRTSLTFVHPSFLNAHDSAPYSSVLQTIFLKVETERFF